MVSILMGLKGSGKTKRLVDMVREAVKEETGDVVCIERERKLTFDIPYQARLGRRWRGGCARSSRSSSGPRGSSRPPSRSIARKGRPGHGPQ